MPSAVGVGPRPKLAMLATPVTDSFSADAMASAVSAKTPLSAVLREPLGMAALPSAGLPSAGMASPFGSFAVVKSEEALAKTPITPPIAYLDFLKLASPVAPIASPPVSSLANNAKPELVRSTTSGSAESCANKSAVEDSGENTLDDLQDSAPSTATSDGSNCSCDFDHIHKSPLGEARKAATAPFSKHPLSAPPTGLGHSNFPNLRIPQSPTAGNAESPVQSPFSARSVRSPFDWEAALKARRHAEVGSANRPAGHHHSQSCSKASANPRTSIRHIREVVTRTVTYTPRMDPAPKGKRRKVQ